MATQLVLGGVPEHFNAPFHLSNDSSRLLNEANVELEWKMQPGGTGAMAKALEEGELDAALMLTEGACTHIAKGKSGSRLWGIYVASPLCWGIHTPHAKGFKDVAEVEGKVYAISRFGSGSHLMAFVDAQQRGWDTSSMRFAVVGSLDGARKAFEEGTADIFMWEKFTTKWLVDSHEFDRVGECVTPWPCFCLVVSARTEEDEKKMEALGRLMEVVCRQAQEFKEGGEETVAHVVENYKNTPEDAREWLRGVEWHAKPSISSAVLDKVKGTLLTLGLIEKDVPNEELISKATTLTA